MVVTHQPITVLLADPSDVSRFGLRTLLQGDRRFTVIGDAPTDVVGAAQRLHPELIVVDPAVRGEVDLHLIDELHRLSRESRLLILTTAFEPHAFLAAMLKRVHGYFLKDSGGQGALLLETLSLVDRFGVVVVDVAIAEHFWALPGIPIAVHVPVPTILTTREAEVLALATQGNTDKEIADRLRLTVRTVEYHLEQACQRLGASNRVQLGWLLHERGLL